MLHEKLDLDHWIAEYRLDHLRAKAREFVTKRREQLPNAYLNDLAVNQHIQLMSPGGQILNGPGDVAENEQLRVEAEERSPYQGDRIPTDVMVWALGEPSHRAVTKIGGRPYRPRDVPWPVDEQGKLLRFTAQFCFVDSRDLYSGLPGNVLLVFGDDDALLWAPDRLVFEWYRLGLEYLVSDAPPEATVDRLEPYYGVVHRTEDWPDAYRLFDPWYRRPAQLAIWEGTKIGGSPYWIQDVEPAPGRFLAALGSITGATMPDPVDSGEELSASGDDVPALTIGDGGVCNFFIDHNGVVTARGQCY